MVQSYWNGKRLLLCLLLGLLVCLPGATQPPAHAEMFAPPVVTYNAVTHTISIGRASGVPAASEVIDVPTLAVSVPDLVVEQSPGVWLIKANVIISTTARLEATNATITELRLDSPPLSAYNITAKRGGHLLIDGIKVSAWEDGALDTNITNQRSYLLALEGGRMDIRNSEVSHLGWADGEPSGLSWRKRRTSADPTTGATGSIVNSNIHDNYFGMYSFEAYNVDISDSEVHDNISYGIDPHDDSREFDVFNNKVYNNGKHGIIFSRDCKNNRIYDNEVYNNLQHGIMLDRGTNNNEVYGNTVYGNQDGIAIFQSSNNLIRDNFIHHNRRGIRINATFDADDRFDDVSTNNEVRNNRIEDNTEHGIYLYARADRNLIGGNQILRSTTNGIYIKSGGNRIQNNQILSGTVGINIRGGEYLNLPAQAKPALDPPGDKNIVIGTRIAQNSDTGIRISGGKNNRIGPADASEAANQIEANGADGIVINQVVTGTLVTSSTGNQILGNIIRQNGRHGISIKAASSTGNRISRNSITGNGQFGIRLEAGVQGGLQPPVISSPSDANPLSGTAPPGATVEIYSDPAGEGQTFLAAVVANGSGQWSFTLPGGVDRAQVTALATDVNGNSSQFSGGIAGARYTVEADSHGQTRIRVTGSGAVVTLPTIKAGLGAANGDLLEDLGNGIWLLNANLFVSTGVTLNIGPDSGVRELRLRSEPTVQAAGPLALQAVTEPDGTQHLLAIDYSSFVTLITHSGTINLENVKVYSWDPDAGAFDTDVENGRAYILAKYDAALNIRNSDIGYLGSADGESYGISWRDVNPTTPPLLPEGVYQTRVTGEVINSKIHHNYYGIYTYQASNMLFRGNEFYDNVRYGFDPHDYTHTVVVEENLAYRNGAHGFIISRGCNNFIIRNNKSYNNIDPGTSLAHGFMLDPGSPNSSDPQAPSYENLIENNEAYGNEGYGLRILGSINNQVRNNHFHHNQKGIVVDTNSPDNLISQNTLEQNLDEGLVLRETADRTVVTGNVIKDNGNHGLYVRSNNNEIVGNTANTNRVAGIALLIVAGVPTVTDNQVLSNTIANNVSNGLELRGALRTLVQGNLIDNNQGSGVTVVISATQNSLVRNTIRSNKNYGILVNGAGTFGNAWSENQLYDNLPGGISLTGRANGELPAPQLLALTNNVVSGLARPNVTVELYADTGTQGRFFLGRTTAAANGSFSLPVPTPLAAPNLTALAIDAQGNASGFSASLPSSGGITPTAPPPTSTPTGTVTPATPTPTGTLPTATPTPTGTPPTATPQAEGPHRLLLPLVHR
jgi:parallel beta-helix repeat protein